MSRIIPFILVIILVSKVGFAQQNDKSGHFGGPISTITSNKLGNSISFGGWGTFMMRGNFNIGIYGQISTSIISKKPDIPQVSNYEIKNRFTGLWFGYYQSIERFPKIHIAYFNKIGFGSVYIDDIANSTTIYDKALTITPSIETIFGITPWMHIGIGVFYEVYSGVSFLNYSNNDFNTIGASLSIRFCPAE
ncbi:MAG: hypothetical protein KAG84_08385 [Bacteroidales bacterium]|nr:hypothetical protein [Bacteroidales bacterium]